MRSLIEQEYINDLLAAKYPAESIDGMQLAAADTGRLPEVVVTGEPEAPTGAGGPAGVPEPRFGRGGVTKAQSEAAGGLEKPLGAMLDMGAATVKGMTQGFVGLPGDIESLAYGVKEIFRRGAGESVLDAFLRGMEEQTILPKTEEVRKWLDENVGTVAGGQNPYESIGEVAAPGGYVDVAKAGLKGAKALGTELAPVAGKMAEDYMAKTGGLMKAAPDIKVFNEPIKVQPSINTLSGGFDNAIANFTTLDQPARIEKTKQANQALAKWLGTNSAGKTKPLLTTNGKLLKTEKGVEGGEPITLPDGRNVESAGLALSPAFKEGKFTTCPNSASCAGDCLGKTSGGYFFMGGGADLNALKGPRMRSFELTQAFMRDPKNFAIKLNDEITALKIKAAQNGNHLAIRLNVLSDVNPRVYEKIIKGNPDVTFYDYTKNNTNPIAPNHHYTYSSTGVSQPAGYNGLTESINNPNQNWKQMRRRLDSGSNVAMAFSHKSILPERVIDEETGKIYKVIDGDTYDFRPLDIQPPGADGVIVGLRNKANTRKEVSAAKDSNGFFVHFDPQIQKVKGKQVRDESGKPVYGNRDVTIAKQGTGQITLTNDYQPLGEPK